MIDEQYFIRQFNKINRQQQKEVHSEESQNQNTNIPQINKIKTTSLKLYKLTDDKKIVNLEIKIKVKDFYVIDNFDWNLNNEHVSIREFVHNYVEQCNLDPQNIHSIYEQIMNQLTAHIQNNTRNNRQQNKAIQIIQNNPELVNKIIQDNKKSENESETRNETNANANANLNIRNKVISKLRNSKEKVVSFLKRDCVVCLHKHKQLTSECQNCFMPFRYIFQSDNQLQSTRLALKFFSIILQKIEHFQNEKVYQNNLTVDIDFINIKTIYKKVMCLIREDKSYQSKQELMQQDIQIIQNLYNDFLTGKYDEDQFIKNTNLYSNYEKEHRMKNLVNHRQRGRPISYQTLKKYILKNRS